MEIRQMIDEGYDPEFSCALSAATATVGPIFPPSIPMIIYAMLSGASVGKLFAGGMIPGVALTVIFMIYSYIISQKRKYPMGQAQTFKQFLKNTVIAFPALFTVVLLLGGIYSGVCTPTEAGALASAYAIVIGFLVYRSLSWKVLWRVLKQTARDTATLALLTGTAYLFSFIVSREKIPALVSEFVLNFTHNKYVFLFIVNIVFLLLGCVLDVSCIQLVFIPMVLPMVREFGIDLIHFGVVICLNMMIGLSTPPFGMLLFIVTKAGNTKIGGVIREILPMVLLMIVFLFLMTYIPEIVMFIPDMMT
jgi:tripartite ATP-independent transporter DctM subunit